MQGSCAYNRQPKESKKRELNGFSSLSLSLSLSLSYTQCYSTRNSEFAAPLIFLDSTPLLHNKTKRLYHNLRRPPTLIDGCLGALSLSLSPGRVRHGRGPELIDLTQIAPEFSRCDDHGDEAERLCVSAACGDCPHRRCR